MIRRRLMIGVWIVLLVSNVGAQVVQNLPMEEGETYLIHEGQGLTVELGPDGTEVFRASNGLHVIGHADRLGEFTLEVISPGALRFRPGTPAAWYDTYWIPRERAPRGFDLAGELRKIPDQHKPYTPGTGGAGRGYVSPASVALVAPLSDDNDAPWTLRKQALTAMRSWVIEEIETRPLSHVPFRHAGDRYSRKVVNAGTPREWKHTQRNAWGWNAFDHAHLYLVHAYTLAAYGDPLGTLMVALVGRWAVASAYPGVCTSWMTQPRAQGWSFELAAWMDVLELWPTEETRARFTCGLTTEEIAHRWLEHTQREHWQRAGLGDNHNSPLKEAQLRGHLGFHRAIRLWGLTRVIRSGLPKETRRLARQLFDEERTYLEQRGIEGGLMCRVVGTHQFLSASQAQEWADRATAAGRNTWEVFEAPAGPHPSLPAGWFIREQARVSDTQLLVAPLAVLEQDAELADWWLRTRDKARWTYDLATASVIEDG